VVLKPESGISAKPGNYPLHTSPKIIVAILGEAGGAKAPKGAGKKDEFRKKAGLHNKKPLEIGAEIC
jgi:hypothetical protein